MAHMNGTATCGGAPYRVQHRVGYVNGTYNGTATSGHAFSIGFGVQGVTSCVRLTDLASGASGCVAFDHFLLGRSSSGPWTGRGRSRTTTERRTPTRWRVRAFWGETWSVGAGAGGGGGVGLPVLYDRYVH